MPRDTRRARSVARYLLLPAAPYALVAAAVVAANAPSLFGVVDTNPLLTMSGLGMVTKGGLLAGRFTIDPNVGTTAQSLGHLAAVDLLHGRLPWWNPYEGLGAPLAGEMQSAALFPPTLLLALGGGQLLFHMLLESICGMATFRLLVRLGVATWVAVGAGCAFALNGTVAWLANAPVDPIAFLPLLLLGIERARAAAQARRRAAFGLVAVALALSVYAGFPEVAYLDGVLAALWALVRGRGLERAELFGYARKVAAGVAVGALLAAPILVAFADYLPAAFLGPHAGGFDAGSVPGAGAGILFFPYAAGPIFGLTPGEAAGLVGKVWIDVGGYLTTTLLLLAAVALWSRRLRALRVALAAWVLVALGRTYGVGPAMRLFDLLPAMSRVEAYRYLAPSIELACVVLAFLALDDLRRGDVPRWVVGAAVLVAASCALGTLVGGRRLLDAVSLAPQSGAWLAWSLAWGCGTLAVAGAAALARGRRRGPAVGLLTGLVVLEACAMLVVPQLSAPQSGTVDTALVGWLRAHTGTERVFTLGGLLNPNYGSDVGVAEADVNDLPMPEAYAREILGHLDPATIPNHFDGTTVVGGGPGIPVRALGAHLAAYEALGVGYVAAYTGSPDAASLAALGLRRVYADPHSVVYRLPHPTPLYSVAGAACTLSGERIGSVRVDCRGPAVLVRRELDMAGWSATAAGRSLPVHRAGALFQSVTLRRGRATVRFSFVPPHEEPAFFALLAGLLWFAASWAAASRRGPRHRPGRDRRRRGLSP